MKGWAVPEIVAAIGQIVAKPAPLTELRLKQAGA